MNRTLIAAARAAAVAATAVFAMLAFALPADAQAPKDQGSSVSTGDGTHGTFSDLNYGGPNHHMNAVWDMGKAVAPGSCCNEWSEFHLTIDANALPDYNTHNTCVQVAVDWRVPDGYEHYDIRVLRVCKPNSNLVWDFSERETDKDCQPVGAAYTIPCLGPMGRVQFARYVPALDEVVGPKVCRAMGGVQFTDCTSWEPRCVYAACRIKSRSLSGNVTVTGSLDATDPNEKRKAL